MRTKEQKLIIDALEHYGAAMRTEAHKATQQAHDWHDPYAEKLRGIANDVYALMEKIGAKKGGEFIER